MIDSYSELSNRLQVDVSASVQYAAGGASARLNLLQSAIVKSQSVYILVSFRITNKIEQLKSFHLTSDALSILEGSTDEFFTMYGDGFIQRIGYGSELYALMQIDTKSDQRREDLRLELEASYGTFSADASISSSIEKLAKDHHIKVLYSQSGGNWGPDVVEEGKTDPPKAKIGSSRGGVLVLGAEELLLRIREFASEAREHDRHAEVIWADVLDYGACQNKPPKKALFDPTRIRWVIDNLGALYCETRQLADSWAYYLQGAGSVTLGPAAPSDEDLALLRDINGRLERTIRLVSLYPNIVSDRSIEDMLDLRLLAQAARQAEQAARKLPPAVKVLLQRIDGAGIGSTTDDALKTSCLSRETSSSQLACLLLRSTPARLPEAPPFVYASGMFVANGEFQSPWPIKFPAEFVDSKQSPEIWIDLSREGEDQFNLGHVLRNLSPEGAMIQICLRRGASQCMGYDKVVVRWVARRRA